LLLSLQFIGPIAGRNGAKPRRELTYLAEKFAPTQQLLPPGLATEFIASQHGLPWSSSSGLVLWIAVTTALLHVPLRAQYAGERLSDSSARFSLRETIQRVSKGWRIFGLPSSMTAVIEKELRSLSRSTPMLFTLIMPPIMLLVFRFGPAN